MTTAVPPCIALATRPLSFDKTYCGPAAVVEHERGLDPYTGVAVVSRYKESVFRSNPISDSGGMPIAIGVGTGSVRGV